MIIFAIIFVVVFIVFIYDSSQKYPKQTNYSMSKEQKHSEAKRVLKKYFIESIENDETIKSVKDTELEAVITFNLISNLYNSCLKNFLEQRYAMGLTEVESRAIVKSVTNDVMDIFISNSKQFHIK